MPLLFVRSQQGKPILTHHGYTYTKHHERESSAEILYICRIRGCTSQIVAEDDAVIEDPGDHPHAPNSAETVVIKAANFAKDMAATIHDPPSQIVARVLASVPQPVQGELPRFGTIKRNIRNNTTQIEGM